MKHHQKSQRIPAVEGLVVFHCALALMLTQASGIEAARQAPVSAPAAVVQPALPVAPPGGSVGQISAAPSVDAACSIPVDVAIVFDRSVSMTIPQSKLDNARAAAGRLPLGRAR